MSAMTFFYVTCIWIGVTALFGAYMVLIGNK